MKTAARFVTLIFALSAAAQVDARVTSPPMTAAPLPVVTDCKNHYILDQRCSPAWIAINTGLPDLDVRVLAVDPIDHATAYAGGPSGIFKSVDGGGNWNTTGFNEGAATIADTATAFARIDFLPGWFVAASTVTHLAIDFVNSKTIYATTIARRGAWFGQHRFLKSVDGGETWTDGLSPNISGVDNIHSLAMAPTDPATLYITNYDDSTGDTWSPIVATTDGALSWTYLGFPVLNVLSVDPGDSRTVYAGTFAFEPYFTSLPNGVLKSTDGGTTWAATGLTGTGITALTVAPGNRRTIFAATTNDWPPTTGGPLFKSIDGGANWAAVYGGPSPFPVTAVVVHSGDSNRVYVATLGGGVVRSVDGGVTWTAFNGGLTSMFVQSLVLVEGDPNTLYAGTRSGVFKIAD